jgi:uncharacterized protein
MLHLFKTTTDFDLRFKNISTLIVKVTHRCNLDCLYCYENITKTGEDMSVETFCELADLVLEHSQKDHITFLFHGGEPSLLPNEWYEECIQYAQRKAIENHKQVSFSMQTNLLGVNPSKIELYKKYDIQLGVSLDGPAMLQSTMRGGEDKVFANFKRIQNAGVKAGVLVTINESNYQHFSTICHWLVQEAEVRSFKANVVTPVGRGYDLDPMSAEQIFQAQYSILEYLIATKGEELMEANLNMELLRYFAEPEELPKLRNTLCHEHRCGAGSSVLAVTPMGDFLPCGRFTWDESEYYLGSLHDPKALKKKYQRNFQQKIEDFHAKVPESWYNCDSCEARDVCGFGCQAFIVRSKQQANVDCLPTKMRYQFYKENEDRLYPVYLAIKRRTSSRKVDRRGPLGFKIKGADGKYKTYSI